jgi:hypothetical protein
MINRETYGVYSTPQLDKYQEANEEIAEITQDTWNFGLYLQSKGLKVKFMHGPVGMYEGTIIEAISLELRSDDHVKEFIDHPTHNDERYVFFLYQKLDDRVRYTTLTKDWIDQVKKGSFDK